MGIIKVRNTRLCLEQKAEEFRKVGEISHTHEEKYFNSAVSRYYYSMYVRIMQICKTLEGSQNTSQNRGNFETHQATIRKFTKNIRIYLSLTKDLDQTERYNIDVFLTDIQECCDLRNKADYKIKPILPKDVKLLRKTLDLFDRIYPVLLKIARIEEIEGDD